MLPSSNMSPAQFTSAAYGVAAVFAWGTSDFLGGYATRRANAFLLTVFVNIGGLVLVGTLASASHAIFPSPRSAAWVLAGGISGGAALGIFYRALSSGRMGLTAPVAAVVGAAIPTVFSMFTEGIPGRIPLMGFFFAAVGLWLITRAEEGTSPDGIGLALLAGVGFAGFYLCVRQAGDCSAWWIATFTRTGGLIVTGMIVLAQRKFSDITSAGVRWGLFTGCVDSLGTILFVRASQTGRLDEAVVISSLYPAVTVLLARVFLQEHFTRWRFVGLLAALAAVPMIASG
ncbi:MAG: DMT family transporter [Candidatus Sulfotelmatobacter sp.]|jgi:drug/metabolite transporter (DMT)-like permease